MRKNYIIGKPDDPKTKAYNNKVRENNVKDRESLHEYVRVLTRQPDPARKFDIEYKFGHPSDPKVQEHNKKAYEQHNLLFKEARAVSAARKKNRERYEKNTVYQALKKTSHVFLPEPK